MTALDDQPRTSIRVDMTELSLRDQRDINRILHDELGCSFTEALQDWRQPDALALAVWKLRQRDDPALSRDDALDLSYAEMEMVDADLGKRGTATTTRGTPPPSLVWRLNPADVMELPSGLLDEMDHVLVDERHRA